MKLTDKDACGTSFYDVKLNITPQQLIDLFGEPQCFNNDGKDKTNMDYALEDEDGNVITIYDWKEYTPLKMDRNYNFHIGGKNYSETSKAKTTILKMLEK